MLRYLDAHINHEYQRGARLGWVLVAALAILTTALHLVLVANQLGFGTPWVEILRIFAIRAGLTLLAITLASPFVVTTMGVLGAKGHLAE